MKGRPDTASSDARGRWQAGRGADNKACRRLLHPPLPGEGAVSVAPRCWPSPLPEPGLPFPWPTRPFMPQSVGGGRGGCRRSDVEVPPHG